MMIHDIFMVYFLWADRSISIEKLKKRGPRRDRVTTLTRPIISPPDPLAHLILEKLLRVDIPFHTGKGRHSPFLMSSLGLASRSPSG